MKKAVCLLFLVSLVIFACDTQTKSSEHSKSSTGKADIQFNISVSDITIDEIYIVKVYYGIGTYEEGQSEFEKMIKVKSQELTINPVESTHGNITFTKSIEFETDFTVFYMAELINNHNIKIGNLKQIYQETQKYQNNKSYTVDLTIDGLYGDMNVDFWSHFF